MKVIEEGAIALKRGDKRQAEASDPTAEEED